MSKIKDKLINNEDINDEVYFLEKAEKETLEKAMTDILDVFNERANIIKDILNDLQQLKDLYQVDSEEEIEIISDKEWKALEEDKRREEADDAINSELDKLSEG